MLAEWILKVQNTKESLDLSNLMWAGSRLLRLPCCKKKKSISKYREGPKKQNQELEGNAKCRGESLQGNEIIPNP